MKTCPFCAEEIQDAAIVCRYCGRDLGETSGPAADEPSTTPPPDVPAKRPSRVPLLLLLIVLVCIVAAVLAEGNSSPQSYTPSNVDAAIMCQKFVKDRLKAPATAKFPNAYDAVVTKDGSVYSVLHYVDSENSFGAMIRSAFSCELQYTGNRNWKLLDLVIG